MNAIPHTLAGVSIGLVFYDKPSIGIPLAISSHFLLDYINEDGFTAKDRLHFDIIPSVICIITSLFLGNFWFLIKWGFYANLPDLIDKKFYLSVFFPKKFKSTEYLHWQKPRINPTPIQTKWIGIISSILIISILWVLQKRF